MTKFVGSLTEAFRLVFEHMETHPDERVAVTIGEVPCGTLPSWNELTIPPVTDRCPQCDKVFHRPFTCSSCGVESVPAREFLSK